MSDHRINCSLKLTLQEQESLMRLKTMEYLATSTITLTSLAQLLGKISNMVINDHIQEQVEQALEAIHQVREQLICDHFPGPTSRKRPSLLSEQFAKIPNPFKSNHCIWNLL